MTSLREDLAKVIFLHQPKPIPINYEEALYIADGILAAFTLEKK